MKPASFYSALTSVAGRPAPFSVYTARELWTDEHTSSQMLAYHLNGDIDVSSRRTSFIDKSVQWMGEHFNLARHSRVIDFGCGPGLYTSRIARLGADVVGIDFSSRSLEYARSRALAWPDATRPTTLGMSQISLRTSDAWSRVARPSTSPSTASRRPSIFTLSTSG